MGGLCKMKKMPGRRRPQTVPLRLSAVLPLTSHGQNLLVGALRHLNASGVRWTIRPVDPASPFLKEELDQWQPDGALIQSDTPEAVDWCRKSGTPYVKVLCGARESRNHLLTSSIDDSAVGRMAAEYYLSRGYRHFAFVGNGNYAFSLERHAGFEGYLRAHGCDVFNFVHSTPEFDPKPKPRILYHSALADWLAGLPKPVAVFGGNDWEAHDVVQACASAGISIPGEALVLGAGDDRLMCRLCTPEISSVKLPFARVGSDAARILVTAIRGKQQPKPTAVFHPPITIVTRPSSDDYHIVNPLVRKAVNYMQAQMDKPVKIASLLRHLGISRPNLERHFKTEFGHTPLVELRRQRIERAKSLLADTGLTNAEMASRSGFSTNIRFIVVFKQLTGLTPAVYREKLQYENTF